MHVFELSGGCFVSVLLSGELLATETCFFALTSLEEGSRQGPERFPAQTTVTTQPKHAQKPTREKG